MLYDNIIKILKNHNISESEALNIYLYGSRVYGCNSESADYDLIIVTSSTNTMPCIQFSEDDMDVTVYNVVEFRKKIVEHEISVLECLFLPKDKIIKEESKFNYLIDLTLLRESLSRKSSNSFVKAKKKFEVEKDFNPYIARKSLFHSLRILMFGIQIAKYGKIVDYTEANNIWKEIINTPSDNWEDYKQNYQGLYNHLKSEFRKLAPL